MEQSNKAQNSVIFSIAEIIGKMSNQVNFLIRHDKLLSQLDVDMLMENTRKLYDTVCSVNCNMDVDSIPMEIENNEEVIEIIKEEKVEEEEEEVEVVKEEEIIEEEEVEEEVIEVEEEDIIEDVEELNDIEEEVIEFKMDFEIDSDSDSDSDSDTDIDEKDEDVEEDSGIRSYIKTPAHHTLGERLESSEDNSLASVLQKKSITDLMTAIDLNDRFMFLNELFDSNMEKYNKAIRALNNFSTLLGAKTYMSELQIELQWDCESDAYKRLANLIERRYI